MREVLPKYLELSRSLEAQIAKGTWSRDGKLPSVREIASENDVSAVTASRALQVLRDKGLITCVERTGSRLVRGQSRWGVSFRTTPGPWQRVTFSLAMTNFEQVAKQRGFILVPDVLGPNDETTATEMRRQIRGAVNDGIKGLFLMPSRISDASMRQDERILAACREAGLPVVLIERNLRGDGRPLAHDLVGTDDVDGGYQATRHLQSIGRRRIAFVYGSPTSSHNDRLAGYLLALHKAGMEPLVFQYPVELPGKQAHARLASELIHVHADGVVCYQDVTAIGLVVEVLSRSLRIPEELAIVGYDNTPIGDSFTLGITTFAMDVEEIARRAFRIMEERIADPDAPPVRVLVPGKLVIRETSGPDTEMKGT